MAVVFDSGPYEKQPLTTRTNRVRRGTRVLGMLVVILLSLPLIGAMYEALSATGDAQTYPPPGRLVDVGGYRLHLHCLGTGTPTVVLDAGLGGMSLDWNLVQADIARTTQVCAYDRAGMGWSDVSPEPRTPEQIARELHTLLTNADIPGPYVLVGHSLGGKNLRVFAFQHPELVAGMVLVDTRSEVVDMQTSPADMQGFQTAMREDADFNAVMRRLGLVRLFGAGMAGVPTMPAATRTEMALFVTGQNDRTTTLAEAQQRTASDTLLQAAPSLGAMPLIVLAAGQNMNAPETNPHWPDAQRQLAALSTRGRLLIAEGSGHYIHWERPALVIESVVQVVGEVRNNDALGHAK